jgi:hypothetical protein
MLGIRYQAIDGLDGFGIVGALRRVAVVAKPAELLLHLINVVLADEMSRKWSVTTSPIHPGP